MIYKSKVYKIKKSKANTSKLKAVARSNRPRGQSKSSVRRVGGSYRV